MGMGVQSFREVFEGVSAILIPDAFFISIIDPAAQEPNALNNLAYVEFSVLVITLIWPGISLVRK